MITPITAAEETAVTEVMRNALQSRAVKDLGQECRSMVGQLYLLLSLFNQVQLSPHYKT